MIIGNSDIALNAFRHSAVNRASWQQENASISSGAGQGAQNTSAISDYSFSLNSHQNYQSRSYSLVNQLNGSKVNEFQNHQALEKTLSYALNQSIRVNQTTPVSDDAVNTGGSQISMGIDHWHSYKEHENLNVDATGKVITEDGREINFRLALEMEHSFELESRMQTRFEQGQLTDPLMLNFGGNAPSLTEQVFSFDIDADGDNEEIRFAGKGSGFLAFDKNGDGEINDGSELFGAQSGDGFADLNEYDDDSNGWIDENDEIFDKLQIWTKDANGKDKMLSLKEAGVGALYLDSVKGNFSLKDQNNQTLGQIRQTGVFLTEEGDVRSMQQVDLADLSQQNQAEDKPTEENSFPAGLGSNLAQAINAMRDRMEEIRQRAIQSQQELEAQQQERESMISEDGSLLDFIKRMFDLDETQEAEQQNNSANENNAQSEQLSVAKPDQVVDPEEIDMMEVDGKVFNVALHRLFIESLSVTPWLATDNKEEDKQQNSK